MSNYYVNLSASSNGSGTIGSPWTWLQFYADVSGSGGTVANGDNIYLRGSKNITSSPSGNKSFKEDTDFQIKLLAWDLSAYGPWSIYDSLNRIALNGVIEINGGIIVSDYTRNSSEVQEITPNIMLYTSAIETSFIKAERISLRSFPSSSATPLIVGYGYCRNNYCGDVQRYFGIFGSTIISDDSSNKILDVDFREPTLLQIKDSIIYIQSQNFQDGINGFIKTPVSAISAIWNWNTVPSINLSQLSGTVIITSSSNIQYKWNVPIHWPSWSANKQDFNYMILGKNITITGSNEW